MEEGDLSNLFSDFTVLTNLLVACSLTFVNSRLFSDNRTYGAITVNLVACGLIHALVLQKLYDPQQLGRRVHPMAARDGIGGHRQGHGETGANQHRLI